MCPKPHRKGRFGAKKRTLTFPLRCILFVKLFYSNLSIGVSNDELTLPKSKSLSSGTNPPPSDCPPLCDGFLLLSVFDEHPHPAHVTAVPTNNSANKVFCQVFIKISFPIFEYGRTFIVYELFAGRRATRPPHLFAYRKGLSLLGISHRNTQPHSPFSPRLDQIKRSRSHPLQGQIRHSCERRLLLQQVRFQPSFLQTSFS